MRCSIGSSGTFWPTAKRVWVGGSNMLWRLEGRKPVCVCGRLCVCVCVCVEMEETLSWREKQPPLPSIVL